MLGRAQSSTTFVNAEHLPKQLSVYSPLQHMSPWPCLPNTDDFDIRFRCQSLLVTLSMDSLS